MTLGHWGVVGSACTAFALALALVPVARRVALDRGLVDRPAPNKAHESPTPYLGGVAIAAAVAPAAAAASAVSAAWVEGLVVTAGAGVIGALGLVDDARGVTVIRRLAIEALVASAAFLAGVRVELVNDPVDLGLTVIWFVVIANAVNLLDNIDGVAASVAAISGGAVAVACVLQEQWPVAALAAAVAGGCLGFLVYNWHPASIFMGDAGSLLVGFLLAAVTLEMDTRVGSGASLVAAALIVSVPLFDTTLVVISRIWAHRSVLVGATDHTAHRLLRVGLGHRAVVAVLAGGTAVTAVVGAAVALDVLPPWPSAVAGAVIAGAGLVAGLRLPCHDQRPGGRPPAVQVPRPPTPPHRRAAAGRPSRTRRTAARGS